MLLPVLNTISFLKSESTDDPIDRLHYYYTSTFLIGMGILISFKMFAGKPMECWVPAEYSSSWEDFTEMFCWARNTYWVPFDEAIPEDIAEREFKQVSYYQWTPFFLLICAFAFYFPCIIWRIMNDKSGVRLRDIIGIAQDKHNIRPESRSSNLVGLAAHLQSIFRHQFHLGARTHNFSAHKLARCFNCRYYEAYMTMLYLSIKVLYLANVSGQLFLMNRFLQTDDYSIYGIGVLIDLLKGREWHESGNFPRVTLCDMQIRVLGNVQRHTVQCVLVINIFTEKLFILLWLWFSLLSVLTLMSLLYWACCSMFEFQRHKFIVRRLELADTEFRADEYEEELTTFVRDWIKLDGIFVLRMITIHTGIMFCTELVDTMWDQFLEEKAKLAKGPGALCHSDIEEEAEGEAEENKRFYDKEDPRKRVSLPPVYHTSPSFRPQFRRKQSVFVPLVVPGLVTRSLMPQTPEERKRFFKRSKSVTNED